MMLLVLCFFFLGWGGPMVWWRCRFENVCVVECIYLIRYKGTVPTFTYAAI